MYGHVFQSCVLVHVQEDAWSRTLVVTHRHLRAGHQSGVLPVRRMEGSFVYLLRVVGRTPQVARLIDHVTGLPVEGNTRLRIVLPSFAITFEVRILAHTCLCPWLDAEGHAIFTALQNFYLCDVRLGKVDAEILQDGVFRTYERHGEHPPVEDEVRPAPVEGEVLPVLQGQAHGFRIRLVVVRDIILFLHGSFHMEIVTSFFEKQCHLLALIFLFNESQGFLHLGGKVFLRVGHDAILTHFDDFFIRTGTYQQGKQA